MTAMKLPPLPALPIDEALPALTGTLATHRCVLLQAPPGAGKSTIAPLTLLEAPWRSGKKILMLEPRRIAARAVGPVAQLVRAGDSSTNGAFASQGAKWTG